jgi:hypothetical protein
LTLVIVDINFDLSKKTNQGPKDKKANKLIVMTTPKKSIDSLKSQKVSGKKVKGGIVATGTHTANNVADATALAQGKLKGRPAAKGGSISTAKRTTGGSL